MALRNNGQKRGTPNDAGNAGRHSVLREWWESTGERNIESAAFFLTDNPAQNADFILRVLLEINFNDTPLSESRGVEERVRKICISLGTKPFSPAVSSPLAPYALVSAKQLGEAVRRGNAYAAEIASESLFLLCKLAFMVGTSEQSMMEMCIPRIVGYMRFRLFLHEYAGATDDKKPQVSDFENKLEKCRAKNARMEAELRRKIEESPREYEALLYGKTIPTSEKARELRLSKLWRDWLRFYEWVVNANAEDLARLTAVLTKAAKWNDTTSVLFHDNDVMFEGAAEELLRTYEQFAAWMRIRLEYDERLEALTNTAANFALGRNDSIVKGLVDQFIEGHGSERSKVLHPSQNQEDLRKLVKQLVAAQHRAMKAMQTSENTAEDHGKKNNIITDDDSDSDGDDSD